MVQYKNLRQYDGDNIPRYMRPNETTAPKWKGIPIDLLESEQYKKLNHRTKAFLILLYVRLADGQQRNCLYGSLKDYNSIFNLGMTDDDISRESYKPKGQKNAGLFTASEKHMKAYGYNKNARGECIRELTRAGFIETVWNEKGARSGWDTNQTVYRFTDKWYKT